MSKLKKGLSFLTLFCLAATAAAFIGLHRLNPESLQETLERMGFWAPLIYITLYIIATLLVLPSTALNLTGGAIFGIGFGLLWTSLAAVIAAAIAFVFARTAGRKAIAKRLSGRWQAMDAELRNGAIFYMFAIRLLPILPYGLVNFAAGLTSVRFQDYLIGTTLGTVPSVLPFVMLGSSGIKAIHTGDILPLLGAMALIGLLVGGSAWYRRRRTFPKQADRELKESKLNPYSSQEKE